MTARVGVGTELETTSGPKEAVSIVERSPELALVVPIEGTTADLPRLMGDAFGSTAQAIAGAGATITGPPFARYHEFGETIRAEVGFPYAGKLAPEPPFRLIELPGGRRVTTTHVGPYETISAAWEQTQVWMGERGLVASGPPWECYLTGPDVPGPPVTEIVWPIA